MSTAARHFLQAVTWWWCATTTCIYSLTFLCVCGCGLFCVSSQVCKSGCAAMLHTHRTNARTSRISQISSFNEVKKNGMFKHVGFWCVSTGSATQLWSLISAPFTRNYWPQRLWLASVSSLMFSVCSWTDISHMRYFRQSSNTWFQLINPTHRKVFCLA